MSTTGRLYSHPLTAFGAVVMTIALGASSGMLITRSIQKEGVASLPEREVWRSALRSPLPAFPADALAAGIAGVVVTKVVFNADGRVRRTEVLESPDKRLAGATQTALSEWRFVPRDGGAMGKVTLYFRRDGKRGVVFAPGQTPLQQTPVGRQATGQTDATKGMGWSLPKEAKVVSEDEFVKRLGQTNTFAIDVRSKTKYDADHRKESLNIPLKELPERSSKELKGAQVVLIDCSKNSADSCPLAAWTVAKLGVREIGILRYEAK